MKTIITILFLAQLMLGIGQNHDVKVNFQSPGTSDIRILSVNSYSTNNTSYMVKRDTNGVFCARLPRGEYLFEVTYKTDLARRFAVLREIKSDTTITITLN